MMCEKCGKNPATTHIKTVVNGMVKENNLCAYCAAKEGFANFGQLSLANMLAGMLGDGNSTDIYSKKICECCGSTFSDIAASGRVGCSECYSVFREELIPSLNRLHGKVLHVGTNPKNDDKPTKEEKLKDLKKNLEEAIKKEEFELAAKIRDEIKAVRGEN